MNGLEKAARDYISKKLEETISGYLAQSRLNFKDAVNPDIALAFSFR